MRKDIIVFIGTIGSPTFDKCKLRMEKLKREDSRIRDIVIIKDRSPQCAWLNEMISQSGKATWCLQVDEDMYLNSEAITTLLSIAQKKESQGTGVGLAHGMLWDLFLEQPVGSLKLWRSKILRKFKFKNVLGSDRDLVNKMVAKGYKVVSTKKILGDHDSAPTDEIGAKKYYEYVHKIRKFNGDDKAEKFVRSIKNKNKFIYERVKSALSDNIVNKSKDGR